MHPSVREGFPDYITTFEGRVRWMYLDSLGLVSTGVGTLLDPFPQFWRGLPFYDKATDAPATRDQVKAEFDRVKLRQDLIKSYTLFEPVTNLRLRDADIDARMKSDVGGSEGYIRTLLGAAYDQWPADAQLAVLSIIYGAGSLRNQALIDACKKRDWLAARGSGNLSNKKQGTAGYAARNAGTRQLFQNAYIVDRAAELGLPLGDRTVLYGLKRALNLARWQTAPDTGRWEMTRTDVVTAGDITSWVKQRK